MPTPEEIKKIAQEVANKIEPKKGYGGESYWIRTATEIIEKIVEDYCIVPKSKIQNLFGEYDTKRIDAALFGGDMAKYRHKMEVLTTLFGTELFNEEKE